ncbi:MAG: recombinase family protein [Pseudomonadota bacterium]
MQVAAIYARYSDDAQRETSIEDQVRRCTEVAQRHGFTVREDQIFTDAALSGTEKATHKRLGYHALLAAWDKNQFNALIVDELPRLARDVIEFANLQSRIEKSGVRLISADGLDSIMPNWQLQFQIVGAIGQHFIRETRHRVIRGMQGQLERGFMIAAPAFGYDLQRMFDAKGEPVGSNWVINETEANIVREIYAQRRSGMAYAEIAKRLNNQGVKPPRQARKVGGGDGYWRPGSVYRLLTNTIYRGIFVLNGSGFIRAKAKKEGRELNPVEFKRPELRLIDDETWNICSQGRVSRTARGGGKHMFAGLVTCVTCGGTLTVSSERNSSRMLYCPQCAQAKRVAMKDKGPGYTSTGGVTELLKYLLEGVLQGDVLEAFRIRLRERLEGGSDAELAVLRDNVSKADKACARMSKALADVEGNEHIERECRLVCSQHKQLKVQLKEFEDGLAKQDKTSIEKQLQVTPASLVNLLFTSGYSPERVRAVLCRLFPKFVALGKLGRHESVFEVTVVPGVALAEMTGTATLETGSITRRFSLKTGAKRPVTWVVKEIDG